MFMEDRQYPIQTQGTQIPIGTDANTQNKTQGTKHKEQNTRNGCQYRIETEGTRIRFIANSKNKRNSKEQGRRRCLPLEWEETMIFPIGLREFEANSPNRSCNSDRIPTRVGGDGNVQRKLVRVSIPPRGRRLKNGPFRIGLF